MPPTKPETRRRLLAAALAVLDEGEALTTTSVTKRVGLSQPSFYVYFSNMEELLEALTAEHLSTIAFDTIEARHRARTAPGRERFRETFRIPMQDGIENPAVFRLLVRHRHDESSPLGRWSRGVFEAMREDLVVDLAAGGFPTGTARQRRRVEMIADGIIALSNEMVAGHLEGRYPDLDEAIDVLIAFSKGYLALLPAQEGATP